MTDNKETTTNKPNAWLQQITRGTDQACKSILAMVEEAIPKVPENVFVDHILPIFAISKNGEDTDISIWQDIAGNMQRPIDVIDTTGEILFRCPAPLQTLSLVRKTISGDKSVRETMEMAKLKSQVNPKLGASYLYNSLETRIANKNKANMDTALAWNNILIRYGYDPILPDSLTETKKEESQPIFSGEDDAL